MPKAATMPAMHGTGLGVKPRFSAIAAAATTTRVAAIPATPAGVETLTPAEQRQHQQQLPIAVETAAIPTAPAANESMLAFENISFSFIRNLLIHKYGGSCNINMENNTSFFFNGPAYPFKPAW